MPRSVAPAFPLGNVTRPTRNASGLRRSLDPLANGSAPHLPTDVEPATGLPPLLARMLGQQAATGLPPPYLPKHEEGDDT